MDSGTTPPRLRVQELRARMGHGREWLGPLCLICALAILYGSLIPFDFTWNWPALVRNFREAWQYWPLGSLPMGRRDILVNVVFYMPLGLLLASYALVRRQRSPGRALLWAILFSAAVSTFVESAQLFLPSRISQVTDVLSNTTGGVLGGFAGLLLARFFSRRRNWTFPVAVQSRPAVLGAAAILVFLTLDGLSPLQPILSLSDLRGNLAGSHLTLADGAAQHLWHHWLVCRMGVYAILTILLGAASTHEGWRRWVRAAVWAGAFAIVIESGKPLVDDCQANIFNVVTSVAGTAVGLVVGPALWQRLSYRATVIGAALLLVAYIAYVEWTPFAFVWTRESITAQLPKGLGWIPLANYALGVRRFETVQKFLNMGALTAALVYVLCIRSRWLRRGSITVCLLKAAALATALGLFMEGVQFFLPDRGPTTTDVLSFTCGGAAGVSIYLLVNWQRRHARCAKLLPLPA